LKPAGFDRLPVFPDFIRLTHENASIWVDRRLADPDFVDRLADADQFFERSTSEIVKDQKKIKIARTVITIAETRRSVYIKRYNAFSLRYKLLSPLMKSGALRSLEGARILQRANVATVTPVAAIENRVWGTLTKSFFISEEISGGKTADAYWRDELQHLNGDQGRARRRGFLLSLAEVFRRLHGQHIYHNDLKDANILTFADDGASSASFFLLDLEGVRQYRWLRERRRVKNLVQLHRTLGRYLRRADKLRFLKNYLGPAFADRTARRRLIASVLGKSKRLDSAKGLRVGGKSPLKLTKDG
jgi:serine/threonine protein kinase